MKIAQRPTPKILKTIFIYHVFTADLKHVSKPNHLELVTELTQEEGLNKEVREAFKSTQDTVKGFNYTITPFNSVK